MQPTNSTRKLSVVIQRQSSSNSVIELEFTKLKCLRLIPLEEKYTCEILGSTLTFGDNVIDLMGLPEKDLKDLQGVFIFGDGVTSITGGNDFGSPKSKNSLSVVVFNRDIGRCLLKFYPSVKSAIWLNASRPDECPVNSNCDLILVPRENLSDFQNRYPYNSKLFSPLEDKISGLGYVDFLSFLKMLSQETINVE
jgi:hypothetical protein